jgi:hypothetical protein
MTAQHTCRGGGRTLRLFAVKVSAVVVASATSTHAEARSLRQQAADPYQLKQLRWKLAGTVTLPIAGSDDAGAGLYAPLAYRNGLFAVAPAKALDGCPLGQCIALFDKGGRLLNTIGAPPPGWGSNGTFYGAVLHPTGLAFDAAGNIYESDKGILSPGEPMRGGGVVQEFGSDGRFIRSFGCSAVWSDCGNRPDAIRGAADVEVTSDGTVVVLDLNNDSEIRGHQFRGRLLLFGPDGQFKRAVGGGVEDPPFGSPSVPAAPLSLDLDPDTDRLTAIVGGESHWAIGSVAPDGSFLGQPRVSGTGFSDAFAGEGTFFPCGLTATGRGTFLATPCGSGPFEVRSNGQILGSTVALPADPKSADTTGGYSIGADTALVRDDGGHFWFGRAATHSLNEIAACSTPRECIGGRTVKATQLRVRTGSFGRLRLTGRVVGARPRSEYTYVVWTGKQTAKTLRVDVGVVGSHGRISEYLPSVPGRAPLKITIEMQPMAGVQFGIVSRLTVRRR